ncbi:MAG: hypothetical protein ACXABI_13355 [Candidatus Hodarchaeales archaeon]|jgi:hypothetical protein
MGKIKKFIGITAVVIIAIIYTLGSIVDLLFDTGIAWLDWRLFVVLPVWLVIILIALMIVVMSFSDTSKIFGSFMQDIDAYGKLMNLEEITKTAIWRTKWPEIQAIGQDFIDEKDAVKQQEIYQTLKLEMDSLGEELVSLDALDSDVWRKLKADSDDFERKVKQNKVNFMDKMYLSWLFSAT